MTRRERRQAEKAVRLQNAQDLAGWPVVANERHGPIPSGPRKTSAGPRRGTVSRAYRPPDADGRLRGVADKVSIADELAACKSAERASSLFLEALTTTAASSGTRRKWRRRVEALGGVRAA